MRLIASLAIVFVLSNFCEARWRPFQRQQQQQSNSSPGISRGSQSISAPIDALDEVNRARARRGLRPFIRDNGLSQAAAKAASERGRNRIKGHTNNDFKYSRNATSAGCGAMEPSWGWNTCCTYENHTYAGAAYVMGADGNRYMHLYVR